MIKNVLLFAALAAVCYGVRIRDCAPGGQSAVKFYSLTAKPYPIQVPGMVELSLDAEVTRGFTNFDLNVTLVKYVQGNRITIPCLGSPLPRLGTCYYENACPFLDTLFPDKQCPPLVQQCTCPFTPHTMKVPRFIMTIPSLPPVLAPIISGKVEFRFELIDRPTKRVFSCLEAEIELDCK